MTGLTRAAIERSRLTLTLIALVVFGGIHTYLNQSSQEDPEITIRTALVTVRFPGMSAPRVEQLIAKPLEEAIKQIAEVETVKSTSETGTATLRVEAGARYDDVRPIWTKLRNKMDDIAPSLPEGSFGPFVNDEFGRVAVTTLALRGADYSMAELRAEARWLRDRLAALPLVSRIDLYGVQDERIWLEFDRARLAQLGLSPAAVVESIAEQNRILPAGALETEDGMRYAIEPSGSFPDERAIGDVPIATPGGGLVYARDIVAIRRGFVEPARTPVYFQGEPAVVVAVSMVEGASIKAFGAQLAARLQTLRGELPLGMALDTVTDQAPIVAESVREATVNLGQTLLTVLAVVLLFLGLRAGLIVGAIVPLTILVSLVGMLVWDIPLHRISIAAIIIALGLLVDNGVVIAEDVKRRIDTGSERLEAALAASRTLAIPLLTSSLTTILAFLPLMLAQDATGEFLRALSQVIILALLSSWLLAITVTPLLCYWFLPSGRPIAAAEAVPARGAAAAYAHLLGSLLRVRRLFLLGMVALLAFALVGMGRVPTGLLPPSERAQFVVNVELPAGASEAESDRVVRRLAQFLADRESNPDVTGSVFYVGHGGPRFFLALSPLDPAPHVGFGVVNTATSADVGPVRARLEAFIAEQLPEAMGWTELLFLGSEPPGTLKIRVKGEELDRLYALGREVAERLRAIPGTRDIRTDWANPVLQLDVLIDQERARRAAVPPSRVAQVLEATFEGVQITGLREGDKTIPVTLRALPEGRMSIDALSEVTVMSTEGVAVPLVQVALLAGELQPAVIRRHDQERAITMSAVNPTMTASELLAAVEADLETLLPRGYRWEPDGEVQASADANAALFTYMPHCLAGILLVLVWQFNSLRRTAIILLTIPLVLIGAALGLNVMHGTLDFNAMLGLFSLAGIIINNGIVLIDRIDEERGTGQAVRPAILAAAAARLRPIVMTALTTILGLVPLHLFGGALWYSMTVVMMFGLAVGTVLTLGVVPALYALLFPDSGRAQPGTRVPPRASTAVT